MNAVEPLSAEQSAYTARLEPLFEPLLRYFARRVMPRDDAYDCVSETLLVVWRRRESAPQIDDEFRAWTYGIARHVLNNHLRSQRRRERLAEKARDSHLEQATPPSSSEPASLYAAAAAMKALSDADRELVRLIVWDGLGVGDAGFALGLTPAVARTRYSRARARLRRMIGEAQ